MADIISKVLITGASGTVGSYVDFGIRPDQNELDITDMAKVTRAVSKYKPAVILHLAAETDLARCESKPDRAYFVNSVGTYNLALAAKNSGARMVYVSTDDVFQFGNLPHSEKEEPSPGKIYGHSKYLGELAVRALLDDWLIVRTAWVFGGGRSKDKKFVAKIIEKLGQPEIKVVNDQSGSPTFAKDLVEMIKQLINKEEKGIVHVVNDGICSRYDVAIEIGRFFGSGSKIVPTSAKSFNLPSYSISSGGLISNRLKIRSWQEALKEYLSTEWKK